MATFRKKIISLFILSIFGLSGVMNAQQRTLHNDSETYTFKTPYSNRLECTVKRQWYYDENDRKALQGPLTVSGKFSNSDVWQANRFSPKISRTLSQTFDASGNYKDGKRDGAFKYSASEKYIINGKSAAARSWTATLQFSEGQPNGAWTISEQGKGGYDVWEILSNKITKTEDYKLTTSVTFNKGKIVKYALSGFKNDCNLSFDTLQRPSGHIFLSEKRYNLTNGVVTNMVRRHDGDSEAEPNEVTLANRIASGELAEEELAEYGYTIYIYKKSNYTSALIEYMGLSYVNISYGWDSGSAEFDWDEKELAIKMLHKVKVATYEEVVKWIESQRGTTKYSDAEDELKTKKGGTMYIDNSSRLINNKVYNEAMAYLKVKVEEERVAIAKKKAQELADNKERFEKNIKEYSGVVAASNAKPGDIINMEFTDYIIEKETEVKGATCHVCVKNNRPWGYSSYTIQVPKEANGVYYSSRSYGDYVRKTLKSTPKVKNVWDTIYAKYNRICKIDSIVIAQLSDKTFKNDLKMFKEYSDKITPDGYVFDNDAQKSMKSLSELEATSIKYQQYVEKKKQYLATNNEFANNPNKEDKNILAAYAKYDKGVVVDLVQFPDINTALEKVQQKLDAQASVKQFITQSNTILKNNEQITSVKVAKNIVGIYKNYFKGYNGEWTGKDANERADELINIQTKLLSVLQKADIKSVDEQVKQSKCKDIQCVLSR